MKDDPMKFSVSYSGEPVDVICCMYRPNTKSEMNVRVTIADKPGYEFQAREVSEANNPGWAFRDFHLAR